ncbi:hypothetical protein A6J60_007740 [Psychrobacter sp. FDAARGOS_221]|nr:hypothetical protein A6J60_007740 [Psychrobacter sp. FDAARGOS_221]
MTLFNTASPKALAALLFAFVVPLTACQTTSTNQPNMQSTQQKSKMATDIEKLTYDLSLVEENHLETKLAGDTYILDTFIVPFEQPYYVLVRRTDEKRISKNAAELIAETYIQPRGCTEPLKRREDLDKQNAKGSVHLVGIEC